MVSFEGEERRRLQQELSEALERREREYARAEELRHLYETLAGAVMDAPDPAKDPRELGHPYLDKLQGMVLAARNGVGTQYGDEHERLREEAAQLRSSLSETRAQLVVLRSGTAHMAGSVKSFLRDRDRLIKLIDRVRVLRATCDQCGDQPFRVHLLEHEWDELTEASRSMQGGTAK
jgi:hypothetical protein